MVEMSGTSETHRELVGDGICAWPAAKAFEAAGVKAYMMMPFQPLSL